MNVTHHPPKSLMMLMIVILIMFFTESELPIQEGLRTTDNNNSSWYNGYIDNANQSFEIARKYQKEGNMEKFQAWYESGLNDLSRAEVNR